MRCIIFFLFLLYSSFGLSQTTYPINQYFGSTSTLTNINGAAKAAHGFINGVYPDTLTANSSSGYLRFYPGAQIMVGDSFYLRDITGTKWLLINGVSGGGGGTWGSITGTLSNQTDLQNALNLKASLVSPLFTTPRLNSTSSIGYVWMATDVNGNGSFQAIPPDNLIVATKGSGTPTWYTSGDSLYLRSINGATIEADGSLTVTGGSSGITIGSTTITGGTNTRVLYNNSGVVGEYTTTGSGTTVALSTTPTFVTKATISGGTVTANDPPLLVTQTWNNSGVAFRGLDVFITNTAAASGSRLAAFRNTGGVVFSIDQNGTAIWSGSGNNFGIAQSGGDGLFYQGNTNLSLAVTSAGARVTSTGSYTWSQDGSLPGSPDLYLHRLATGSLAVSSGGATANGKITLTEADLGIAGTSTGLLKFSGVTSGTITIQPAAIAGTYTLTLPIDDGTSNQFLQTNGSGVLTWATPSGSGDVNKVGTPVNNQLGVWTGDGTIEGDPNLTFASSTLNVGVAGASTGLFTLSGVTSGTVTIQPASAAGTYTLTLPTDDGSSGQFLQTNGSGVLTWATASGSGDVVKVGTPSNHQWGVWTGDGTLKGVTITASRAIVSDANGDPVAATTTATEIGHVNGVTSAIQTQLDAKQVITTTSSAHTGITPTGTGIMPVWYPARVSSDFTMTNGTSAQDAFPSAINVWTLQGNTTYYFKGVYAITSGTTSHAVGMSFALGGGASLTRINYAVNSRQTTTAIGSATATVISTNSNTAATIAAAAGNHQIVFEGWITMNAGGTVTPQITFTADPTGTILMKTDSWIMFTPVGDGSFVSAGPVN